MSGRRLDRYLLSILPLMLNADSLATVVIGILNTSHASLHRLGSVLVDPSNSSKYPTLENTLAQVVFQSDTNPIQTCQLHSHFGLHN